jgi:glycosyltransferase involved in cell wall biosynthesis
MRIAIDGTSLCARDGSYGAGIEHYSWSIVNAMICLGAGHRFFIFVPPVFSSVRRAQLESIGDHVRVVRSPARRASFFSRHILLPLHVAFYRPDVFFSPMGQIPLGWFGPSVVTVHDLAIYDHPEWFPDGQDFSTRLLVPRSFKRATKIIAVSDATRRAIQKYFPITEGKVQVVGEGVDVEEAYRVLGGTQDDNRRFPFDRDFVLSLGTIEPRKNLVRAAQAFDEFLRGHPEQASSVRLIIAGKKGWKTAEIEQEISRVNLAWKHEDRAGVIQTLGSVTEEEKWQLLARATCLLFPSFDEGFGLPVLEAMAVGTPVIASNRGALPEVGGDAVMYVEPDDVEAMSFALTQCLLVPEGTRALKEAGLARAQEFTWEKVAKGVMEVIESVTKTNTK